MAGSAGDAAFGAKQPRLARVGSTIAILIEIPQPVPAGGGLVVGGVARQFAPDRMMSRKLGFVGWRAGLEAALGGGARGDRAEQRAGQDDKQQAAKHGGPRKGTP